MTYRKLTPQETKDWLGSGLVMPSQPTAKSAPGEVSGEQAIEIARLAYAPRPEDFALYDALPEGVRIWGDFSQEPCWFIHGPALGGRTQLGAGRMIVISRRTGRVLYDGSDGGE